MTVNATIGPHSTMREVLGEYPGAQRALFRKYHIGGCSSCGFSHDETLQQVCGRNGNLDVDQVLSAIAASHEQDERVYISPKDLAALLASNQGIRLVDVRSREEFEAVHLPGSMLLSQDVMQKLLGDGSNETPIVLVDHQGRHAMDAAAYLMGHGLQNVRCLRGGLDAWAREIDKALPRYTTG